MIREIAADTERIVIHSLRAKTQDQPAADRTLRSEGLYYGRPVPKHQRELAGKSLSAIRR
jgi:hypothetical protein